MLLIGLALSVCFIVACGGGSGSTTSGSEGVDGVLTGPKTCYMGEKSNGACVRLKTINGASEGYLNPYSDSSFMAGANKEQYRRPVQAVDLVRTSPSLKIAPNFMVSEFMSTEKGNFGIFSTFVVKKIQEMRQAFGTALKINSAFRSPKWNSGIDGSAKWSRHQYGDGLDISSTKANLQKTENLCKQFGATYTLKYTSHVHCDWRNEPVEPEFFGAVDKAQLNQMSNEEARVSIIAGMTQTSELHVSGELKAGNIVLLSSSTTYTEDPEGELLKEWNIIAPNGDEMTVEQSEVSLPLHKGTYQITHTIGGNIILRKTLFVN